MAKVIVSIDGVVIKEAALHKERSTLGRRPYNDIVIDNLAVSGEHVAFLLAGGTVTMEDLNSTNGTYVNGTAVKKQVLQNTDTIEIGKYKIVFSDGVDEDKTPMPEASSVASAVLSSSVASTQTMVQASIQILSGGAMGRDLPLTKVVTTVGKPGVSVASITRRQQGYVLSQVEGPSPLLLNGQIVEKGPTPLNHGDLIELADTRMQFALK
jgi:FHA domain